MLSLTGWAAPAFAACSTFAPASSATVDCTGTSTQGIIAEASTGVTIGVHTAASIVPAANGALDPTHVNWGIDVGSGAQITIDNGGSVDTSSLSTQSAIKLNSGSTLTINGVVKGDNGVVGTVATSLGSGFANSVIKVGSTGQVIGTQPTTTNSAGLNGSGGGNTFQIDGFVQSAAGSAIFVGTADQITIGSTGHLQTLATANGGGIYNTSANNVVVTTAAGSLIEAHNATTVSGAIGLGTGATIVAAGGIHVYPGSGPGIQVGANGNIWLKSTGTITTDAPVSPSTLGGRGIAAGNGSTVVVDGTINTGRGVGVRVDNDSQLIINGTVAVDNQASGVAFGASFGIGSTVVIGATGKVSSTGSATSRYSAALGSELSTSSAKHGVSIDIFGRVERLGTSSASAIYLEGFNYSATPVPVTASTFIEAGASVYSQSGPAYSELDGAGGYPDVAASITIAGDVETGVVGGKALDLNDGVDTVTFLPTYRLVGSVDGGSDPAHLAETDTLAFDGAAGTAGTFDFGANRVMNFEAGHKTGAGSWTLNGNATGTDLAGNFAIDAGKLSVNGTMTDTTFTVASGATLGGVGRLGTTTILAGGTHAPGNSIGTQTINGNYVNHGTLAIEVSPTDADKVVVNGAVNIADARLLLTESPASGWTPSRDYTIIDNDDADAVTGTFVGISDNFAFLDPTVTYTGGTGNDVVLTLTRNALAFSSAALTRNEAAAATGAESLGGSHPVYDAILPLSTSTAPTAFDQLSGEVYASLAGQVIGDSRTPREAAFDRIDADFAALADQRRARGRSLWTLVVGDAGVVADDGNAARSGFGRGGFLAGGDAWLSDRLLLGAEAGVTSTSLTIPDRSSTADIGSAHVGLYGGLDLDPVHIGFGAAISGSTAQVRRTPSFPGFADTLSGQSNSLTGQLFADIGYTFTLSAGTVQPFVSLALAHTSGGGYAETGGPGALTGASASLDAGLLTVGIKGAADLAFPGDVKAHVSTLLGWEATTAPTPTATHAFAGGTSFTVAGAPLDSHAVFDASIDVELSGTSSLALSYKGSLGAGGGRSALLATLSGSF